MAVHYPADYNIFSLVCIEDSDCSPSDKSIVKIVNDKLDKYGYIEKYGEFIATAEDDKIIKVILDLEQMIGSEIIWIRGNSFEKTNKSHGNIVPNMARRYCTTDMKMNPIANFVYNNIMPKYNMNPVFSNVGFRYDEIERAKEERDLITNLVVGKRKTRNKWAEIKWGIANYPLIYDKINNIHVRNFWSDKHIDFPEDSNCVGCFWKDVQQLRKNWNDNESKMEWFSRQERNSNYNYKSSITYDKIKNLEMQSEFNFGTGSGCQAGYCTD